MNQRQNGQYNEVMQKVQKKLGEGYRVIVHVERLYQFNAKGSQNQLIYMLCTLDKSVHIYSINLASNNKDSKQILEYYQQQATNAAKKKMLKKEPFQQICVINGFVIRAMSTCGCLSSYNRNNQESIYNKKNDNIFYIGTNRGTLIKYSLNKNKILKTYEHNSSRPEILKCCTSPNSQFLVAWNLCNQVLVFLTQTLQLLYCYQFQAQITSIKLFGNPINGQIYNCVAFKNQCPPFIFPIREIVENSDRKKKNFSSYYHQLCKKYCSLELSEDQVTQMDGAMYWDQDMVIVCAVLSRNGNISVSTYYIQQTSQKMLICYPQLTFSISNSLHNKNEKNRYWAIQNISLFRHNVITVLYSNEMLIYYLKEREAKLIEIKNKKMYSCCQIIDMNGQQAFILMIKGFNYLSEVIESKQNELLQIIGDQRQEQKKKKIISDVRNMAKASSSLGIISFKLT